MNIYVLVVVSYDYYKFQENKLASTDLPKILAKAALVKKELTHLFGQKDITITLDQEISDKLGASETRHLFIETYKEY